MGGRKSEGDEMLAGSVEDDVTVVILDIDRMRAQMSGVLKRVRRAEAERRRMIDFDEARKRIEQAEAERDEAVARADVAEYTRDALAFRCRELDAEIERLRTAA